MIDRRHFMLTSSASLAALAGGLPAGAQKLPPGYPARPVLSSPHAAVRKLRLFG